MAQSDINTEVRRERLRVLRNWFLGVGIGACAIAVLSFGQAIINNPEAWAPTGGPQTSFVAVLAGAGWRPLAGPMLIGGAGLIVLAVLLTLVIGRR